MMERKQIVKLCVSGIVLALSVLFSCGVFTGGTLTYEKPKIDRRAQDGTYSAQKVNNFSTVQVDMTLENRAITDCKISSWGSSDLMTDEIRSAWADAIVESQSGTPDAITGATLVFSAGSVQEAVADILAQAVGEKEPDPIEPYTEPEPQADPGAETEQPAGADGDAETTEPADDGAQTTEPAEDGGQTDAPAVDSAEASAAVDNGIDRLMRPRPAIAAAPAADSIDRLMRPRPAIEVAPAEAPATEAEAAAEPEAVEEAEAAAAVAEAADVDRLMRPRPAIEVAPAEAPAAEAEAAAEPEAVEEAEAAAAVAEAADVDRLMRPKPVK